MTSLLRPSPCVRSCSASAESALLRSSRTGLLGGDLGVPGPADANRIRNEQRPPPAISSTTDNIPTNSFCERVRPDTLFPDREQAVDRRSLRRVGEARQLSLGSRGLARFDGLPVEVPSERMRAVALRNAADIASCGRAQACAGRDRERHDRHPPRVLYSKMRFVGRQRWPRIRIGAIRESGK